MVASPSRPHFQSKAPPKTIPRGRQPSPPLRATARATPPRGAKAPHEPPPRRQSAAAETVLAQGCPQKAPKASPTVPKRPTSHSAAPKRRRRDRTGPRPPQKAPPSCPCPSAPAALPRAPARAVSTVYAQTSSDVGLQCPWATPPERLITRRHPTPCFKDSTPPADSPHPANLSTAADSPRTARRLTPGGRPRGAKALRGWARRRARRGGGRFGWAGRLGVGRRRIRRRRAKGRRVCRRGGCGGRKGLGCRIRGVRLW